jgi:hypothetical protein
MVGGVHVLSALWSGAVTARFSDTAREDLLPVFSNTGGLQPMAERQHEISKAQYTGIDLLEFAERRARPRIDRVLIYAAYFAGSHVTGPAVLKDHCRTIERADSTGSRVPPGHDDGASPIRFATSRGCEMNGR